MQQMKFQLTKRSYQVDLLRLFQEREELIYLTLPEYSQQTKYQPELHMDNPKELPVLDTKA